VNYFNLIDYYKVVFLLTNSKRLSVTEIENMYPWEYDIYIIMLNDQMEMEAREKQEELNRSMMS